MSRRTGLPDAVRLKPRAGHYVEALVPEEPTAAWRMIPVAQIHPNPNQPRQRIGRLDALVTSIREHGVLQPILVRRLGAKDYQIIAGERRFQAARQAGLREVACVEREAGEGESLELALVENVLRDDLTPFEEASAYEWLIEQHGHTHESLARRVGKPRTSVTESLALLNIPEGIREMCAAAGLRSRRQLLRVARQPDEAAMAAAVERLARGLEAEDAAASSGPAGATAEKKQEKPTRPKPFVFRFAPRGAPFRLQMTFRRSRVDEGEVLEALRELVRRLEESSAGGSAPEGAEGAGEPRAPAAAPDAAESGANASRAGRVAAPIPTAPPAVPEGSKR